MNKSKRISVLISIVLIFILALGAVSAADDSAISDDSDLSATNEIQTVDNTQTTNEIDYESNDIVVTDTGDSSDSDTISDSEEISDNTGLKDDSDNGDEAAVVSDASSPKNLLKAEIEPEEPLRADDGTFSDLADLINEAASGSTIYLFRNYVYNAATDSQYVNGIDIAKNLNINGNGFTIDANGSAKIFNLIGYTVTIQNTWYYGYDFTFNEINFKNAYSLGNTVGGAITSQNYPNRVTISNCNFTGNIGYRGPAVYVSTNNNYYYSGSVTIRGSVFEGNYARENGGAIYSGINNTGSSITVTNSVFVDNNAQTGHAIYYVNRYAPTVNYNWWGTNTWSNAFVANSRYTYVTPTYRYQAALTLTDENTVSLTLSSNGNVPTGSTLPARDATFSISSGGISPETATFQGSTIAQYATHQDATITATVDNQVLTLNVPAAPKMDINELDVSATNVTLPNQPVITIQTDVDGKYNVTITGRDPTEYTITGGELEIPLTGYTEGEYTVVVSRTNDPVYNDKVAYTSFKIEKTDVTLSIAANATTIEYGENVTIIPTIDPSVLEDQIKYYVDGIEKSSPTLSDLSIGNHTVEAKYAGDDNYNAAESNTVTITVTKIPITFQIAIIGATYPDPVGILVVAFNSKFQPVNDLTILVTVNGVTLPIIHHIFDYVAFPGLNVGSYPVHVVSLATDIYEAATDDTKIAVVEKNNLTISASVPDTVHEMGDEIVFSNIITAPAGAATVGTVTYYVNGTAIEGDRISTLGIGNYTLVAKYTGDPNFNDAESEPVSFNIRPKYVYLTVKDTEVVYPGTGTVVMTASLAGSYNVSVGNETHEVVIETMGGSASVDFGTLDVGNYTVYVKYYNGITRTDSFPNAYKVLPGNITYEIVAQEITYPSDATITFKASVPGNYTLTVAGRTLQAHITAVNETTSITIPGLDADSYDIALRVNLANYNPIDIAKAATLVVKPIETVFSISPKEEETVYYGDSANVTVSITEGATGTITYYVDGVEKETIDLANEFSIEGLNPGEHTITAKYNGNQNYMAKEASTTITVNKLSTWIKVITHNNTYPGNVSVGAIVHDANNIPLHDVPVLVTVNGVTYYIISNNYVGIEGLNVDEYPITAVSLVTDLYESSTNNTEKLKVEKNNLTVTVAVSAPSIVIDDEIVFSNTITAPQGAKTSGTVTYYVNGSAIDGDSTIPQNIGEYTVVAKYTGDPNFNDAESVPVTFTVLSKHIDVEVTSEPVVYPNGGTVTITAAVAGNYTVIIGDERHDVEVTTDGGSATASFGTMGVGTHDVKVEATLPHYGEVDQTFEDAYEVIPGDITYEIDIPAVTYPAPGRLTFNASAVGDYTLTVGGRSFQAHITVANESTYVDLPGFDVGTYDIALRANIENYNPIDIAKAATFVVNPIETVFSISPKEDETVYYGDSANVTVSITEGATGTITYSVDGVGESTISVASEFHIDGLSAGEHTITARYNGDGNHTAKESTTTITVKKAIVRVEVFTINNTYPKFVAVGTRVIDAEGNPIHTLVQITVDDILYIAQSGDYVQIDGLSAGRYNVEAEVDSDNYESPVNDTEVVIVEKNNLTITANIDSPGHYVGEEIVFSNTITAPEGAVTTGTVTYYANLTEIDGDRTSTLPVGEYTLVATYTGDPNFNDAISEGIFFDVYPLNIDVSIQCDPVSYPNTGTVTVTAAAAGTFNVTIGRETYEIVIEEDGGSTNVTFNTRPVGKYTVEVTKKVDGYEQVSVFANAYEVIPGDITYEIDIPAVTYPAPGKLTFNASAVGDYTLTVGGRTFQAHITVANETYYADLPGFDVGTYDIALKANIENYNPIDIANAATFVVNPIETEFSISPKEGETVHCGDLANITVTLPEGATGNITYYVDGVEKETIPVANEFGIEGLKAGEHTITARYNGDETHTAKESTTTITVNKAITRVEVFTINNTYPKSVGVGARIIDAEGNPISGGTVLITVNDVTYAVQNGNFVQISGLPAGRYDVKAEAIASDIYAASTNNTEKVIVAKNNLTINVSVSNQNSYLGDEIVFSNTITAPEGALTTGTVTYIVNGSAIGGDRTIPQDIGEYTVVAKYTGDDNFNDAESVPVTFTVLSKHIDVEITSEPVVYPNGGAVTITVSVGGFYTVTIGDENHTVPLWHDGDSYTVRFGTMGVGTYDVRVEATVPDYGVVNQTFEDAYEVIPGDITYEIVAPDVTYPSDATITFKASVPGDYTLTVAGRTFQAHITAANETTTITIPGLDANTYDIALKANIENYNPIDIANAATFVVKPIETEFSISPKEGETVHCGDLANITVTLPEGATGNITYYVDGVEKETIPVATEFGIEGLKAGEHTITAIYNGDETHTAKESTTTVTVSKIEVDVTVTADPVTYPNNATVVVNSNVPGTYTIRVGNKDYAVIVGDTGSGSVVIDKLVPGTYDVDISANLGENYEPVAQIPATSLIVNAQTGPFVVSSTGFGYDTLAEALAKAEPDSDIITVIEAGTYKGTQNTGLTIAQNVAIQAAEGLEVIFDAEGNNNFITIETGGAVELHNITVVNGNADYGGAVYVSTGAAVAVIDSVLSNNLAISSGGAIYGEDGSTIIIVGSEFTENVANGGNAFPSGGAIYTVGGFGAIANSTFKDNQGGNSAGAIYMGADYFLIKDSEFINNKALGGSAGALWVNGWTGKVEGCTFTENEARDFGGAIEWRVKEGTLTDSTFTSNKAGQGGAIHWYGRDGKINGTNIFTSNEATQNAGAILWEGSSGTIEGATFTANKAAEGAHGNAIYWAGNGGTVEDSIFDSNTGGAGAIIWLGAEGNIKNSYFSNNGVNPSVFNIYKMAEDLNIEANTFEISTATINADKDVYKYNDTAIITGNFNWGVNDNPIGLVIDSTKDSEEFDFTIENFVNGEFTYELKELLPGEYTVGIVDFTEAVKNNKFVIDVAAADDFVVEKVDATITISADKYEITYGETVELSSVISPADATGAVTYYVDDEPVDAAVLTGLTGGGHTVYAEYAGDDNYNAAVSEPITITVNKAVPIITVSSNKDEVEYGETAELSSVIPIGATGAVTYVVDGVAIEGNILSDLGPGPHTVVARFAGDNNYEAAESEPITVIGLPKKGTYTDLKYQIDKAIAQAQEEGEPKGKLTLEYDFAFDEEYDLANDPEFINGVKINGPIAIDGNGYQISGEEQARIFRIGGPIDVSISNVVLTDGNAGEGYGGAIYSLCEKLDLYNVDFTYNHAKKGGALYVDDKFVMASEVSFAHNEADEEGGAVYVASEFKVQGEFSSNSAQNGGAIFVAEDAAVSISFAQFNDNQASSGSSIYLSEDSEVNDGLIECSFDGNMDQSGATVEILADNVLIAYSNFTNNYGPSIKWSGENGKLTESNFMDNEVMDDGIIYLIGNNVELDGVTIQNNKAGKGVIVLDGATISIADSLFKDNTGEALNYNIDNEGTIESITGTTFETIKPIITMDDSFVFGEIIPVNGTFDWGVKSPEITMNFTVNGAPKQATVIDGKFAMNIDVQPDAGTYTVVISTFTDEKGNTYVVDTVTKTFTVTKATPVVSVTGDTVEYGDTATVKVKVTDEDGNPVTGTVIVVASWLVYGETQVVELDENGENETYFTLAGLGQGGTADINATFVATDNYASAYNDTEKIHITESKELILEVTANDVTIGENTTLNIVATDGAGAGVILDKVNVTVDGGEPKEYDVDEDGNVNLGELDVGEHTITVSVDDGFHNHTEATVNATVNKADADVTVTPGEGNVTIEAKDKNGTPLNGTATIKVDDGEPQTVPVENGKLVYPIDAEPGTHTVEVIFESEGYNPVNEKVNVTVPKYTTELTIASDDTPTYGDDVTVKATITEGATGTITYYVDGSDVGTVIAVGEDFVVSGLSAGPHTITAKYSGDDKYAATGSNELTIDVAKAKLQIIIDKAETYYPNKGTVEVSANNDGVYTITVNDKDYTVTITNGKGSFEVTEVLPVAEYLITWNISESENYTGDNGSAIYKVLNTAPDFSITGTSEIDYGNKNTIHPSINEDATGTITYSINGAEVATLGVKEDFVTDVLDAGHYTVTAKYSGDTNYAEMTKTFEFDVLPIDVVVSVSSEEVNYPNTGSINLTASAPGTYTVLVGNKTYTAEVTEAGVPVVVDVGLLEVGKYEINVTAPASTNYNAVETGAIGTYVVSKAKSVINVTYDKVTGIATVTLEGADDHVKLNETISFELDGEVISGVATTDGRYVSEDLKLAPGKHSIFVVFVGNENYLGSYDQEAFEVDKFNTAKVTVSVDPIKEGEDAIIKVTVKDGDKGLSGVVTVTLDGTDYAVDVTDGEGTLTVKNLVAKETPTTEYPITAKFNGNDEYAEATGTGSIEVTDYNDVIIVISGGDNSAVATLIDSDLKPINGKVNVTVDDKPTEERDVVDGKVIIPIYEEGDHEITVSFPGDETHKENSETATVFVGKRLIATNIVLTVSDITYTENEEVVVTLKDEYGYSLSGKVTLTIGDLVKEVTVTDGQAKTTISGLDAGTKTVIGEYVTDGTYAGTVVSTTFTVKQMKTRIIANNMTTTAINVSDDGRIGKYLTMTLVDAKGRVLANKKVSFGFNAKVYNRTTDAKGQAKLQINLQKAGDYTFAITFLGDKNYEGAFEVVKITVKKQKATMTASGATYKASAKTKTISATLKNAAGNPMPEKKVTFTVNGKTYSATTNSNGVAKVNVSLTKKGSYAVQVKFAGTSTYEALTRKVTLKLT